MKTCLDEFRVSVVYCLARVVLVIVAMIAVFLVAGVAEAQDSKSAKRPAFDEGVLSKHADAIRSTLTLTVDAKQRMVLDRKSWEVNAMSKEERIEAVMKQYRGRGIDDADVRRIAEAQVNRSGGALMSVIEQFVNASRDRGGRGHSRSGNNCTWRNGNCTISINSVNDVRIIHVDELEGNHCSLAVVDTGDGMMRVAYSSTNAMWQVKQSKDGGIAASMILGGESAALAGEDWDDLLKKHPESGKLLTELMVHVGFEMPLSPNDPRVIKEVVLRLQSMYGGMQKDFDEIMKRVDSDEFSVREAAKQELADRFEELKGFVEKALSDKTGSLQQRTTLSQLKEAKDKKKTYVRFVEYVENAKLMTDTKYLASLLENANDSSRKMLVTRLAELTKQDFGDDAKAWVDFVNR